MPVLKYEELTTTDLDQLHRDKTVLFFNVDPIEQHGPHLPLGTDSLQSKKFSEWMVERLQKNFRDWNFLIYPVVNAGCDTMNGSGSIEIRQQVFRAFLYDHLKKFAKDGFKYIIAVTAHAGPRHLVVLEELAEKMWWRHKVRMVSASSKIVVEVLRGNFVDKISQRLTEMGSPMTDAERAAYLHDYHGGFQETSLMLTIAPELVKPIYKTLKPALLDRIWKVTRNSAKNAGDGLGYLGSPAGARSEIGVAAREVLFDEVQPYLERFLRDENVRKNFHTKFYYIPIFRTDFKWLVFLTLYAGIFTGAWLLAIRYMKEAVQ